MYTHITLRTPILLETLTVKSVTFIDEQRYNRSWSWSCRRLPSTTTAVVVKGFRTAFESQMISTALSGTAVQRLDIVDSPMFLREAFMKFVAFPMILPQLDTVRVVGHMDDFLCLQMLDACPSIKQVYHNG